MTFQIIKNAPPQQKGQTKKYPFGEMDVWDAFDLPESLHKNITTAAHNYGKYYDKKFSIRKNGEGYRCQRIA